MRHLSLRLNSISCSNFNLRPPLDSAIYLMDRVVAERADPFCSLERDLLPALVSAGAVRGTQLLKAVLAS